VDRPALEEPSIREKAGPLTDGGIGELRNVVLDATGLHIEKRCADVPVPANTVTSFRVIVVERSPNGYHSV